MMVQPPETRNRGKYENGKDSYFRFGYDNKMSHKYNLSNLEYCKEDNECNFQGN